MKTSKILLHSDKSNDEETPKKVRAGKLLKSILVIFMLSWIINLSSCTVFVRTPRLNPVVIIGDDGHDGHHDNGRHHH
jgi:hypothetical protein